MNKTHLLLDTFNNKIQYDLNKLIIENDTCKLTWVCFVLNDDIIYINTFLKVFISQINYHELQLLIFVNQPNNSKIFNYLVQKLKVYENIKCISFNAINNKLHFTNKLNISLPYISTIYVSILDIKKIYEINYSKKIINYLDKTLNCDIICSSINITDKYIESDTCLFDDDLENTPVEYNGIVWRTDLIKKIHNMYGLDKIYKPDFLIFCLYNNYNIFYI